MQYKRFKYPLIFLLLGFFSIIHVSSVSADEIDLLLKSHADISVIKQNVSAKTTEVVSFEEIPEIGLLRVKSAEAKILEEVKKNSNVEVSGHLSNLSTEDISIKGTSDLLKSSVFPENKRQLSNMSEQEILNKFAWYTDVMTDKKKTLALSQGSGVRIGLIDSGVDFLHPLLSDKMDLTNAKSFVEGDASIRDENGHGTMVSGVMAQIAPQAKLTPYKVISATDGESFWTLQAIVQAVNDGQNILNMSLGTYKYANRAEEQLVIEAFERAISYATAHNVLVVSSAGNNGMDLDKEYEETSVRHLPGSINGVLTTGALSVDNQLPSYSNTGSTVQFVAPGGDYSFTDGKLVAERLIYTTYPTDRDNMLGALGLPQGYMFTVGTSLSAPCISAIVADYLSYYQKMTATVPTVKMVTENMAKHCLDLGVLGKDNLFGNGLPQTGDLLKSIPDTVPPTGTFISQTGEVNTPIGVERLISETSDNSGSIVAARFKILPDFGKLGDQSVIIELSDESGNRTEITGDLNLKDTKPPTAKTQNLTISKGEKINARQFLIDISDNYDNPESIKTEFIGDIEAEAIGIQPVKISLTDTSGNRAEVSANLTVKQEKDVESPRVSLFYPAHEHPSNHSKKSELPKTGEQVNTGIFLTSIGTIIILIVGAIKLIKIKGK